ncbi:MAG: DUF4296 domain-containing protein [Bacteroidaceae bacterium]|nr:DUF4296 domain-containing protein [Bacteroidaceae bacterium]
MSKDTKRNNKIHFAFISCFIFMLIAACCFEACNGSDNKILSKSKMEDVLFDYHLAQGIIPVESNRGDNEHQKYIDAVFEKHGITEAEFDSSLVYYNRNISDLKDIYDNIQERYEKLEKEILLETGSSSSAFSNGSDTTNLWNGRNVYILHSNPSLNKHIFTIKADTSFYDGDKFSFTFNADFVKASDDNREMNIIASIAVRHTDGSVLADTRNIYYTGNQNLQINASPEKKIESISGFFYFYAPAQLARSIAVIRDMKITRTHTMTKNEIKEVKKDTIQDTVIVDKPDSNTIKEQPVQVKKKVISPEELRKMSTSDEKNPNILTAPKVRTPNSIGTRRRRK